MLNKAKLLGMATLLGALVGAIVASLLAPGFLTWYNTPGASTQSLCNCPELTREVTAQLLRAQLIGAAVGGIAFGIAALVLGRRKKPAPAAAPLDPPPAGP